MRALSRRSALLGLGSTALLGACTRSMTLPDLGLDDYTTGSIRPRISVDKQVTQPDLMYASFSDQGFTLPQVPYQEIDPRFYRQQVDNTFGERPGTIIVDTGERFLYLIQSDGSAMRYGVGIGREGFAWSGRGVIQWKQKWPRWKPPNEMVARQPHLAAYSIENGGMAPGLSNPLGARAMYIFKDGQDTLYRLHGSPEWQSIGKAVSSGCVRLINQDVIDLYERVRTKSPILVV